MESAEIQAAAPASLTDVISGEKINEELTFMVKGPYGWRSDVLYYFKIYNLKLPDDFGKVVFDGCVSEINQAVKYLKNFYSRCTIIGTKRRKDMNDYEYRCHHPPLFGDFDLGKIYRGTYVIDAEGVFDNNGEQGDFEEHELLWYFEKKRLMK